MDLDKLREEWQKRKFEGYLFDRAEQLARGQDSRRKSRILAPCPGEGSRMEIVAMVLSVFFLVFGFFRGETKAEAVLWLVAIVALIAVAIYIRRKRRQIVDRRFELPRPEFLRRELGRIAEEIRLDKLAMWLFLPPMAALSFYVVRKDWSAATMAGYWCGVALAAVVLIWVEWRRIRKLEEIRDDVDQQLRDLMADDDRPDEDGSFPYRT